jgi:NAD(P)-dependent dehydrogenase (short-subunit alcohol dehydrogenase family)
MSYLENLFNLRNKLVVVTGSSGQLGRVICRAYQQAEARVVGLDINPGTDLIEGVDYYQLDIIDKGQIRKAFTTIIEEYGSFDILINNAGVSTFEPFEERPEESFDWVMDVNLKGTFFCIQAYVNLADKYELKNGCIVNIGSIFGTVAPDFRNYTDCDRKNSEVYGATKAGIIQMTKYFAVHLAERNIRVNCNPESPQGKDFIKNYSYRCPMGRMAHAEDIAGGLLYLSSEASAYTTGQNIVIDGGMSCW